jgi:hypothetical protein
LNYLNDEAGMVIVDSLRTMMGIRRARQLLPAGPLPPIGSNIVNGTLRIRLKYPVTPEQWRWLTTLGWRTIDMRYNRRRYHLVDDKSVRAMIMAEGDDERARIHQIIMAQAKTVRMND